MAAERASQRGNYTRPLLGALIGALALFSGRAVLWSETARATPPRPSGGGRVVETPPTQERSLAESLEEAFVQVGQAVGPAVVSISTQQIEQVQRYMRVHPYMGPEQFDEFFREFFGGQMAPQEFRRFGLGSGVIIDTRGFILTNEHVVADADKITVTLADGREFSGVVKGKDTRSDLAVIKIDAPNLPMAKLGDSERLKPGQWAIALGNPFGLVAQGSPQQALGPEPTLTVGVISALHRRLPVSTRADRDYSDLIQTDAAINPGNSGGPLVNLQGEIIGINVAILTSSRGFEGVGFAIPSNKARSVIDALIEGREVLYGWLGVQIQDITPDVAEYYGLDDRGGVLIYQVLPDGPAQLAGLRDGDIVKKFDGKPVSNSRELVDLVGNTQVGRTVPVEVLREGKRHTLEIEIGKRPTESDAATETEATELWRGVRVAHVTPEVAERFGVKGQTGGVIVTEIEPGSAADEAGLQPGDLINEINRMKIESLDDYRKAITKTPGNALVRTNRGYVVIKALR